MTATLIARRDLLKAGGALMVGFSLARLTPAFAQGAAAIPPTKPLDLQELDSFLAVGRDGSVTLYSGKVDLGTGARAAYRQIVAEELDVPMARIAMIEGDTLLCPDQGTTSGSTGISVGGMQIRQAAATARQALLAMAAQTLDAPASELAVADGIVRAGNGRTVSYGELVGDRLFDVKVDKAALLKNPSTYKVVGQPAQRPDLPDKMTGRHVFMQDFRVPDMLHARVIRPPAIGATLSAIDEPSIASIPGARIVRIKDFLAVVAESEWNAVRATRALRATWTGGGGLPGSDKLFAHVRATPIEKDDDLVKVGDTAGALKAYPSRFEATYEWPTQSHASMGPSCAVADVKVNTGQTTVWSASQGTHRLRAVLAKAVGLPPDAVRVIYLDGAGCYGANGHDDAAVEAAILSRATGRPVRVQWMREEEHAWSPKGPPQLVDVRAALDSAGTIAAWESELWLPMNTPNLPHRPMLAFDAAGIPQTQGNSSAQIQGNSYPSYPLPNVRSTVHWLKSTPLRPSNLRAPGKPGNSFAVESFIDELAAAAKTDPLEFRLRHLKDEKGVAILKRAAERMDWQSRPSPRPTAPNDTVATGRGIAYVHYKHEENRVAVGVEASVDRRTGKIVVTRIVCAYEAGLMINPDGVRAQVEGSLLQMTSRTLSEEVTFDERYVTSVDWASYPILSFPDAPALVVDLIGSPRDRPMGAGEAASAPVPAAIGNAVFDAIGVRLRTAPLTPRRVLAALDGGARRA
jgi:nicotinate dehydrogenase subunit B